MRFARKSLTLLALCAICGSLCALARAQEFIDIATPESLQQPGDDVSPLPSLNPLGQNTAPTGAQPAVLDQADTANLDGCQVVARIDDQIILACEVLWRVNLMIETQLEKMGRDNITPEQIEAVRKQLMMQFIGSIVDRKLLYNEFRRSRPPEVWPRIEASLNEAFEQDQLPLLMKQLRVDNQAALEHELARLGSSLADERRAYGEHIIAQEWTKSKVKINEEISPDEMFAYYQAHLADFDYPSHARWEELAVRKDRFNDPREAYAALAQLGNEVWQQGNSQAVKGPAFADVAKAKSDGFTAKEGGVRDWTTKGALQCKALDEALFTLQVGQMSPIIDSGPMFHIVRVLERKEAGREPYTDVQADIRDTLKKQRMRAEVEKYLTRLRSEARIWTVFTGQVSAETLMSDKLKASPAPKQSQQK